MAVIVNFCWCKDCAKNKDGITQNTTLRGNTKSSALAFINGTNVVTKYQVSTDSIMILFTALKVMMMTDQLYFSTLLR